MTERLNVISVSTCNVCLRLPVCWKVTDKNIRLAGPYSSKPAASSEEEGEKQISDSALHIPPPPPHEERNERLSITGNI